MVFMTLKIKEEQRLDAKSDNKFHYDLVRQ